MKSSGSYSKCSLLWRLRSALEETRNGWNWSRYRGGTWEKQPPRWLLSFRLLSFHTSPQTLGWKNPKDMDRGGNICVCVYVCVKCYFRQRLCDNTQECVITRFVTNLSKCDHLTSPTCFVSTSSQEVSHRYFYADADANPSSTRTVHVRLLSSSTVHEYRKIPRIRPPFDAPKLMPKRGGGLIREDLTFNKGIESQKWKWRSKVSKERRINLEASKLH